MPPPVKKHPESGFALLFVFAMSAAVAIMLYMELPSVTFEAQRDREQLLIDRGEQYSRAVGLYVRKFSKYPPDFDALDNTQNIRFLRRHYVDPMTGKDEWRLIHVGPGGVFTDSLVYNKPANNNMSQPDTYSTVLTTMQQTGGNPVDPTQQTAAGDVGARRRVSETGTGGGPASSDPNNPNSPSAPLSGIGGTSSAPLLSIPGANPAPANTLPGQQPGFPGQTAQLPPGVQLPPGAQLPPGVAPPAATPGAPTQGSPATNLISNLLLSPRPGGLPGLQTGQTGQQASVDQFGNPIQATGTTGTPATTPTPQVPGAGGVIGGGIAGVASKREVQGIKVYNDRKKYNEWEFVYDASKDPSRVGLGAAPVNNVAPANGAAPATGTTGVNTFGGLGSSGTPTTTTPGQVSPSPIPPPPPLQ